ncbi:MAG: protein-methionine-sulfoxide reductase catalytic subunit MsrP, partial [Sulfuricella sp.]|nr:protein-methionine-sulfoxide reductase catalytic subunit MsrP [Sulfuricella sp.]
DRPTPLESIQSYNNYYEFSSSKEAVRLLAQNLTTSPWNIQIEGEVARPFSIGLEDLMRRFPGEERIYRLRCVEGWSMVIPWNGFPLARLIHLAQPNGQAKYVEFVSLHRPAEMIGQRQPGGLVWPYREALRLDEALHSLAFLATGLYGEALPKQNGAPLRLVVPWKYGFKQAKAITHIRFLRDMPRGSWQLAAASEYGFYGNVNPDVPHPRWSQKREVRIGELRKRPTLPFNGYAEQVAHLYAGLDPRAQI